MREKFEVTTFDNILGMRIFAAQKNFIEFTEIFNKVMSVAEYEGKNEEKLNIQVCEAVGQDLIEFNAEKEKL
jgi:hypothetical protein